MRNGSQSWPFLCLGWRANCDFIRGSQRSEADLYKDKATADVPTPSVVNRNLPGGGGGGAIWDMEKREWGVGGRSSIVCEAQILMWGGGGGGGGARMTPRSTEIINNFICLQMIAGLRNATISGSTLATVNGGRPGEAGARREVHSAQSTMFHEIRDQQIEAYPSIGEELYPSIGEELHPSIAW